MNLKVKNSKNFTREEVEENVKNILQNHIKVTVDEIHNDSSLIDDVGLDSLDIVDLVMQCEKRFSISLPDEIFENGNSYTFKGFVEEIFKRCA